MAGLTSKLVKFHKFLHFPSSICSRYVVPRTCPHRCLDTAAQAHVTPRGWQLFSAVCLERPPVITQEKMPMEEQFQEMYDAIEYENSVLSDHELKHLDDLKYAELKKQDTYEETEGDSARVTALELEDQWEAKLLQFQPADRITEADKTNDITTTQRQLDRKLILLIKQKLGNKHTWVLPQGLWQEGESLRETAERTVSTLCGDAVSARFLGNAPCGFIKYNYPAQEQEAHGVYGAKVFFFKAQIQKGQLEENVNPDVSGHMWLTKEDLEQYLTRDYFKELDKVIIDL